MELKVADDKAWPRREFRFARARNPKAAKTKVLDAIAQVNGGAGCVVSHTDEDGVVRMKVKVRKQDLKQLLEAMKGAKNTALARQLSTPPPMPSLSLEQRLNLMRIRHLARSSQAKVSRHCSWRPALQSIPEEH